MYNHYTHIYLFKLIKMFFKGIKIKLIKENIQNGSHLEHCQNTIFIQFVYMLLMERSKFQGN